MPPLSAITGLPAWVVMWTLAVGIFGLCKWITWQFTPTPRASVWRHIAYLFLWPGLGREGVPRPLPGAVRNAGQLRGSGCSRSRRLVSARG